MNFCRSLFNLQSIVAVICALFSGVFVTPDTAAEWRTKADDNWKVIDLQDLYIKPGTARDLSFLVEKGEAGQHGFLKINDKGFFAFEKRPDAPVRFFCATQLPPEDKGVLPELTSCEKLAEQLRLNGYNAVRACDLDDFLMAGSKTEFVFNPELLDRWERFTAALKKQGIYLIIDATTNSGSFHPFRYWEKESIKIKLKQRLYYDQTARELWMKGVRQIFEHVNPYTGVALKDEPQVAWVALRNEPGLNFIKPESVPGLVNPFRAWLIKRYPSRDAWSAVWGSALKPGVTFETVELPTLKDRGAAGADLQRFFTDIEQETYLWGANFMRSIGLKVPVVDYNNGASMESIIARDVMPFVDNHVYHDHPTSYISPGSKMSCDNALRRQIGDFRWIIPTKMLGRPFTFTEWGGPFWNPYRHHDGITFASYASFQNWQQLTQHAKPVCPSVAENGRITPFRIAPDPAAKANERIAAFVFARGDVMPSQHKVELRLDSRTLYSKFYAGDTVSYSITPLALLAGFGSRVVGGGNSARTAPYIPDLIIAPDGSTAINTIAAAELTESRGAGKDTENLVKKLREKGVLDSSNRTDIAKNIFESDTRELYLDAEMKSFALNTPRSQGVCLPDGPSSMSAGDIEVVNHGACMTLMLASLTTEPVASSKRLLLILSGNALNSDMLFEDESMRTLVNLGKGPVIVRVLDVNLHIRLAKTDKWEVWALAQNGTRVEKIPVETINGRLLVKLKTGRLKNGPTPYFELVASP